MDWQRKPSDSVEDPTGLAALLDEAQAEIGGDPMVGARFLHDADEMLRSTREIEASVTDGETTLWVGFQRDKIFAREYDVYRDLSKQGVTVVAFGEGQPKGVDDLQNFTWVSVPPNRFALENQWFLVMQEPEPLAFVGYETSPEPIRGSGRAGSPAKSWDGFVSTDPRLVDLVVAHLETVVRSHGDS